MPHDGEPREELGLRRDGKLRAVRERDRVAEEMERAGRGGLGIELPERARGRVARIREYRLSGGDALLVHALETAERHVDFAANLHHGRILGAAQLEGYVANRAQVRRHRLADDPVAARRPLDENAVAVREADGGPVDLELAGVAGVANVFAGHAHDALFPRRELFFVERVRQRQHRHEMRVLGELAGRLGADALRRRVGRAERGVRLLELSSWR